MQCRLLAMATICRKTIHLSVVGIVGLFLLVTAFSASLRAETRYSIGVEKLNFEPYFFINSKNEYHGFAREVLDNFARTNGIQFDYIVLPVEELKARFYNGELDFKFPDDVSWVTSKPSDVSVIYSDPLVSYVDGLCILPERKEGEVLTVGVPEGFIRPELIDFAKANKISIIYRTDIESLVDDLLSGQLDGVWGNMDVFRLKAHRLGKSNVQADLSFPHLIGHYRLSTLEHRSLVERFNEYLKKHQTFQMDLEERYRIHALRQLRLRLLQREKRK